MRKNKLSFIALSVASILSSFHINASENIIIDNNRKIDLAIKIKNGIEHINIEKADEKGVSHNYYQKFNVSNKGAVLENTGSSAAKVIINEVTSREKSLLQGNLKINGQKAGLIIANPYGIECDGCSVSGVSTLRLESRYARHVSMEVEGWGAAEGKFFTEQSLPSGSNQIVIKNISQPIIANRGVILNADKVDVISSALLGGRFNIESENVVIGEDVTGNLDYLTIKGDAKLDRSLLPTNNKTEINGNLKIGNFTVSNSNLVINKNAKLMLTKLTLKGDSSADNYGKLTTDSVDIDINSFTNQQNAIFSIAGKNNSTLSESSFKADYLIFDQSSFNVNNAKIEFNINSFENIGSRILSKNSIIDIKGGVFSNGQDSQQHTDPKLSNGEFLFDNSVIRIKNKEFINNTSLEGTGYLGFYTNNLTNNASIKATSRGKKKIGNYNFNSDGKINISVKGLLNTYDNKITASDGLTVNAKQLTAKSSDFKIDNKINKKLKPFIRVEGFNNLESRDIYSFYRDKKLGKITFKK